MANNIESTLVLPLTTDPEGGSILAWRKNDGLLNLQQVSIYKSPNASRLNFTPVSEYYTYQGVN